jgi:hypothetical protein
MKKKQKGLEALRNGDSRGEERGVRTLLVVCVIYQVRSGVRMLLTFI